jgi:hypothetical protein
VHLGPIPELPKTCGRDRPERRPLNCYDGHHSDAEGSVRCLAQLIPAFGANCSLILLVVANASRYQARPMMSFIAVYRGSEKTSYSQHEASAKQQCNTLGVTAGRAPALKSPASTRDTGLLHILDLSGRCQRWVQDSSTWYKRRQHTTALVLSA